MILKYYCDKNDNYSIFFFIFAKTKKRINMKRIISFILIVLFSLNTSSDVLAKKRHTKPVASKSYTIVDHVKYICDETTKNMLPMSVGENIYWTSARLNGKCVDFVFKLSSGSEFVKLSLDYAVNGFMGTAFKDSGLSEKDYKKKIGLTAKITVYNNENQIVY